MESSVNAVSGAIVDASIAVHRELGPGLLESVYESCLCMELRERGLSFAQQVALPIMYRGVELAHPLRLDLLVDDRVIVEVKHVDPLLPVHYSQLISYLRLSGREVGLLLNFKVTLMRTGIKRLVN